MFVQWYSNDKNQLILVILRENWFNNKKTKDVLPGGHPETDAC